MRLTQYGLKRNKIDVIFISHLHGDHIFGLPGLITSYILSSRVQPLRIVGPVGLLRFLDVCINLEKTKVPFELDIIEIEPDERPVVLENDQLTVSAFPLDHKITTSGFVFQEKDKERHLRPNVIEEYNIPYQKINGIKNGDDFVLDSGEVILNDVLTTPPDPAFSYAYCSDTAYDERIAEYVKGCSCIYHEATFLSDLEDQAAKRKHSTARQAALIAKKAQIDKLLIGHFSTRYINLEPLLEEAQSVFSNTYLALEGKSFSIS